MKIFDVEGFPNPARVRIALAEKGAVGDVQFVAVDVMNGAHRTPEFRAKNPDATVPYLELDDGTCLSHCTAITEYIDGIYGGPSLVGNTPIARAKTHMMNRRAEEGLLDAVGAYFHNATPGLGPDLEGEQNKAHGLAGRDKAQATMKYLDGVLASNKYLTGEDFTMADITAFAGLAFADFAKVEIPASLTNLSAWRQRVLARPSLAS